MCFGRAQSLVSVIPGKMEEGQLEGAMQTRGCAVAVVSSWQRVLDGTWCSGVVIKNTSERCSFVKMYVYPPQFNSIQCYG